MFINKCLPCPLIINEVLVLIKLLTFVLKGIPNTKRTAHSAAVKRVFRFPPEKY